MTKRELAFLAVGIIVVVIIIIAIFAVRSCRETPMATSPPNDVPTSPTPTPTPVKPPVAPTAAPTPKQTPKQTPTSHVSVSINAVPWAEVFIKPPGTSRFMKPGIKYFKIAPESNGKDIHVTPIRGKLNVPAGTEIKLVYEGREKIFPYDSWRARYSISHDFLGK